MSTPNEPRRPTDAELDDRDAPEELLLKNYMPRAVPTDLVHGEGNGNLR
ncbi:MAG: hypothetical protein LBE05_05340 [Microbacterium sp.]|jgi:hypothetical protein|nr:hypothetical protein [Microbacterium sp.]